MAEDDTTLEPQVRRRGGFKFPTAYTILFLLILIMTILTYAIPAGSYKYDDEGNPIPKSYHRVEQTPQNPFFGTLQAPITGTYGLKDAKGDIDTASDTVGTLFGAIGVAFFVIIIGGFLGVTMTTGAINAGIARVVRAMRGREKWMIPVLMSVFALGGTTFGMAEETLAFYPLIITVMLAAGYDSLTASAILLLGAGIGTMGSTINPFATGIASGFAGVSIGDGAMSRIVILLLSLAAGIVFVMRYASRVKSDPSRSLVYSEQRALATKYLSQDGQGDDLGEFTLRRKIVLTLFALAFLVMIYGIVPWDALHLPFPVLGWWFPEMTASFLAFAIAIGIAGGLSEERLVGSFVSGASDLLGVALIIGIARGVTVIMNDGHITDTVLWWSESAVGGMGGIAFISIVFILFVPLSFLIPSTSGLAAVTMPIFAPLAGFAGVAAPLLITAYQSASGVVNLVTPTSAVVMGGIAMARVGYGTLWRFLWPLLLVLLAINFVVLAVGAAIG